MRVSLLVLCLFLISNPAVFSQVVINEIIPPNRVELKNIGAGTVNAAGYYLCRAPNYNNLGTLGADCGGDLNIEAGTIVEVQLTYSLSANDDELGLYLNNNNFGSAANIIDYVEWGFHGHTRSSTAEAAGIWSNGDFVPSFTGCASIEYDGSGNASTDWMSQDVASAPCMENTLDGCGGGGNCDITGAGLSNVNCNNNGTPSNPNDDYVTFFLNPTGMDLATGYSVSVNIGFINPTSANYGGASFFQLQNGSAGGPNVTVTITDDDDLSCQFMVVVVNPGSCSDDCDLTGAGLSGVSCDDNNTPSNPNDDFIEFNLNPNGVNLNATYNVSVNMGTIAPTSAAYGGATAFDLNNGSAGDGNVMVTITDVGDPSCTFSVNVIDPGSCSNACDLTSGGLSNINCDDNNTPGDADDMITFTLSPSGVNLGSGYSVSVSTGTINPPVANYGGPTQFTLNVGSAGAGNVTVTITDDDDATCEIDVIVNDPGSCSIACDLTGTGLSNVICNNNGTPANPADDFIMFNLSPSGVSLAPTYSVFVSAGTINPMSAAYGGATSFSLNVGSAGDGNVTVTITDDNDPTCTINVVVNDPGTCSGACDLTGAGLVNVICNNGGTASNPADDIIGFSLNPTGLNLGPTYSVAVSAGTINPLSAAYGAATPFTLNAGSAGAGNVTVTITDDNDPSCTINVVVNDPGTCSDDCDLTGGGLTNVSCNNGGTASDPADDFIGLSLNPSGLNLGPTYSVTVSAGTINPMSAAYGASTPFTLNAGSAGAGNVMVTITDDNDPTCTINVLVNDPETCSDICDLSAAGLSAVVCNSNGTSDDTDDFIALNLNPTGVNLSGTYNVSVSAGTINPASGPYGMATSFALNAGSAGDGDVTVTIADVGDPTCTIDVVVTDPGTCSEMCNLTSAGLGNVMCDDNSTTDAADDFITFILDPIGALLGTGYSVTVSSGTVMPAMAAYGMPTAFSLNMGSAGAGDVTVTVTDDTDATCTAGAVITDPGICSETPCEVAACEISTDSETMICVDDGGETDTIVIVCHPGGSGESAAWIVTDTAGVIQSIHPFSDTLTRTFEGESAGECLIWTVVWDGVLVGLAEGEDVDALAGCFDLSNAVSVTKLSGMDCETATFNPELNKRISLYPIPVSGILHIDARDIVIQRIVVTDVLGRSILMRNELAPTQLDMRTLETGLYYVMFETNLGWTLQRVVVGR